MQDTQKPVVTGDTYSYRGWLVSDKFLKRAFAIMGHYLVASLIVFVPLYLIMLWVIFYIFGSAAMSDDSRGYDRVMQRPEGQMEMDMNSPEMQQMMQDAGMK